MRIDVIHFNPLIDTPLFDKLKIRQPTPMPIQAMIRQLITGLLCGRGYQTPYLWIRVCD